MFITGADAVRLRELLIVQGTYLEALEFFQKDENIINL